MIAVAAFQDLKSRTSNLMQNSAQEAMALLQAQTDEMFHDIQNTLKKSPAQTDQSINSILLKEQTWKSGGFEVEEAIHPSTALETIISIPLKTYKLMDDKRRDLGVTKGERRTRYHVGVIERGYDDESIEPSAIFSYNIGAVSHLASSLERISSKLTISLSFLKSQAKLKDKVLTLKNQAALKGDYSFKSPSQLASDVASFETEAALLRILRHSQSIAASIRLNLIRSRLLSQLKSHTRKSIYSERSGAVESASLLESEIYADNAGSYLDRFLIYSEMLGKIKAIWTATERLERPAANFFRH